MDLNTTPSSATLSEKDRAVVKHALPRPEPGTTVVHVRRPIALLKPGKPPKKKKPKKGGR